MPKEKNMRLNARDSSDVLMTFIQEDRTEIRIYRARLENVTYSLAVASFAISAFVIVNSQRLLVDQFRNLTLLIDLGIISVMTIYFWRIYRDLMWQRRSLIARQDLLKSVRSGVIRDIDPFLPANEADIDIRDKDLYCIVGLTIAVVLVKMIVLVINAASFVGGKTS